MFDGFDFLDFFPQFKSSIGTDSASRLDAQLLGPMFRLNWKLGSDWGILSLPVWGHVEYGLWLILRCGNIDLSFAT